MSKRVAIYARVSTSGQTVENQVRELRQWAERAGHTVALELRDEGISGAKGQDARPGLKALSEAVARREVDMVAAWSVDRLGRSLQDLVGLLNELQAFGCDLFLHQQALDTTTPAGRAMFQMCGVFAEFERGIIRERVASGLERAKAQGKRLGRPGVGDVREAKVRDLLKAGCGIRKAAREAGVGVSVAQRVAKDLKAAQAA
ncbi:DNA-invertase [Caenispirillum salinarum AK4]|uniref:DNA-invertase n=1 Tax=Caenispirillum salinarum AK4 TaxID=1238182 RepID=K9GZX3_9PROT|nr:recombinase family protein [Caenispirillum salinarum]EKV31520.1 DNA-invertase [Caenispirillum salinarum AK4]